MNILSLRPNFTAQMIISYNWLSEYFPPAQAGVPVFPEPQQLSKILTAIGLEVESLEQYESLKGGLAGLVAGEVMTCEKHPGADKLKVTTVNIGGEAPLRIVCGAINVAAGQKVLVATVGSTLYPFQGEPLQIKKATIRGEESFGMICAEDEIGLGENHDGIMILPEDTVPGSQASQLFQTYTDHIFEIGLTPNRMDAMSHLGVARDVCAYLSHHNKKELRAVTPFKNNFTADYNNSGVTVKIEDPEGCRRYSGVSISNITVADSPQWLQHRLRSIGLKPVNNIVDITNFILHETGQPLHAFDADTIKGNTILVKKATAGAVFKTLDEKERKLSDADLMIANAEENMCIAGVYGGLDSGVAAQTKNIFLESACFNPEMIRRTSLKHGLRTDAAARFEKGTDISNTVNVLKRAALLVKEIAGGVISSDIIDIYPNPAEKVSVGLKYHYLKKLSGKNYHPDAIKNILTSLDFEIQKEGADEIWVNVPFSKTDISIPADIVEEIMRIDGLDNVEIPTAITISPATDQHAAKEKLRERVADHLTANGYSEIFTNSITDCKYYPEEILTHSVKMINNLSADLNMLRPALLQTGLEVISYNINRKNNDLKLYEFGKTYGTNGPDRYTESDHLAVYACGTVVQGGWQGKDQASDFYYLRGLCEKIAALAGIKNMTVMPAESVDHMAALSAGNTIFGRLGRVQPQTLKQFGIKETVWFADLHWDKILELYAENNILYSEISKFPSVERDLAIIADKSISYASVEKAVRSNNIPALRSVKLFDVFESEKLGPDKRSLAISFTFADETKTLADSETEQMMNKIISSLETQVNATIRK
ncbi:MAG: phenylalanine--tRNA ligase subunit beta [Ferruginibacter sp.]